MSGQFQSVYRRCNFDSPSEKQESDLYSSCFSQFFWGGWVGLLLRVGLWLLVGVLNYHVRQEVWGS